MTPGNRIRIRSEHATDVRAIRAVHDAAFDSPAEGRIVDALRGSWAWLEGGSLVAADGDAIVGHLLLTWISLVPTAGRRDDGSALALGPMAVVPNRQRQGVGSALVRAGIEAARALEARVLVVLGHPWFYPRFGFTPARAQGILPPSPELADEVWMALRLDDREPAPTGTVDYPAGWGPV